MNKLICKHKHINFDLLCMITEYAYKHAESSTHLYHSREKRTKSIYQNCLDGKIAEYNLYFYLKDNGYDSSIPDLNIYEAHNKSYSPDLSIKDLCINIHVKSMSLRSMDIYGKSIVCQRNDNIVKSPKQNHYFAIMEQLDFLNYRCFKWVRSDEADWRDTALNIESKCAMYF